MPYLKPARALLRLARALLRLTRALLILVRALLRLARALLGDVPEVSLTFLFSIGWIPASRARLSESRGRALQL